MTSLFTPTDRYQETDPAPPADLDESTRRQLETVEDEKRRALAEKGPSWRDWLFFEAFKWWMVIAYLAVDGWIVTGWLESGSYWAIAPSIAAAIYVEFLMFQFLWHRADLEETYRHGREPFRASWFRPVEIGRWTPEAALRRRSPHRPVESIDPDEFL
ncbi:MAG: hypothetical protein ACREBT_02455 [Thermoplasmata archaeon]